MAKHNFGVELGTLHLSLVTLTGSAKSYELTAAAYYPLPQHPDPDEQAQRQRQAIRSVPDRPNR